jgi:predicted TIM-barrel fold metal-dependent hydrolase
LHLEKILLDFPDIRLVACHSGWPWVGELCAIARKFYPRVFLEIGGIAPKYIFDSGTGWDPFFQYANSLLQDQVLFGTDWPAISFSRAVKEIKDSPLKEEVKRKILCENGQRLINETLKGDGQAPVADANRPS